MSGEPTGGGQQDPAASTGGGSEDPAAPDGGRPEGTAEPTGGSGLEGGAEPAGGSGDAPRRRPLARGRPRMVVRIGPDDVGERVSVRFRLPEPEAGAPTESEAVGWLRDWREGVLTIERRDGSHAVIDEGDLVAGRTVPPPPPRRRPR